MNILIEIIFNFYQLQKTIPIDKFKIYHLKIFTVYKSFLHKIAFIVCTIYEVQRPIYLVTSFI